MKILKNTKIVVIGAGGVGSALLPLLAGAGVGKIAIVDADKVSASNLHRQTLYTESQIGQNKARIAAERLKNINSEIEISAVEKFLTTQSDVLEILRKADLCIDATDNFKTRIMVSEACAAAGIREILSSAGGYASQLYLFEGGKSFGDIIGDATARTESSMGLPIFAPAAHLSGVWGAGAALRTIVGAQKFEAGYIRSYDFASGKLFECII